MLEARELIFSYNGVDPVLDSASIELQSGELVLLTGPTGSGKSTLAKCLAGFVPRVIEGQFSGLITIDGKDTSHLPISEYSKRVALVQQDPDGQICTLDVSDEIAFGPENFGYPSEEIDKLVTDSLAAVNALHLKERHTHELSGGEKQRIIIAAMLACKPDYLLLDEPSSSLDPKGILQLREVLTGLKQEGLGILCIEHQLPAFLPISDRILTISDGKVATAAKSSTIYERSPSQEEKFVSTETKPEVIQIRNAFFSYGNRKAVNRVSASIHKGELVALMGDNGSGKTTLLGLIAGLLKLDDGEISLEKTPIRSWKSHEIAERMGVVFQNPNHQIFERTVWKEHTLGLEVLGQNAEEYTEFAEQSLEKMGLLDLQERNPFSLSHGQKRRLNVSSVTVHMPEIYLFDEPFIGQDADGREIISQEMIRHAENDGTCIVITHDMNFAAQVCNRIIFMEDGSILLDGPPQSVLSSLEKIGRFEYSISEVDSK